MPNMVNFGSEKPTRRSWLAEPQLDGFLANFAVPASGSITFFDGQALGRLSSNIVQMDDTAAAEFVGFATDIIEQSLVVFSTDLVGDKRAHVHRPYAFVALIAAAAAGDEGKSVFWLFNNQVAYSTTMLNYAGTVLGVIDPTHVLVLAPWLNGFKTSDNGSPPQAVYVPITANGAIAPSQARNYIVTKAGVCAMTLAAPVVNVDDGKIINIYSATAFAHTITTPGLLLTGSAAINTATFAAFAGALVKLQAYQGKWVAVSETAVVFS